MLTTAVHQASWLERISIARLRTLLVAMLTVSVLTFTGGVFILVDGIFDNFGPRVRDDLAWKTVRGAQELAGAADLGFAMADAPTILRAFGEHRNSKDVMAIVAVDAGGNLMATHGQSPEPLAQLFAGPSGRLRETARYFVSWAGSFIDSAEVGRVAVVVSTGRLVESRRLLQRILVSTGVAGLLALFGGLVFVRHFTRAIIQRDARLARYASTLEQKVAARTAELDQRNRGMRLVLDNVDQGFITVDRWGVMEPERSAIVDRWLGRPETAQRFQDFIKRRDGNAAAWFDLALVALRDDMLPPEVVLDQLPRRLALGDRTLTLNYIAISEEAKVERLLIVMSDVTASLARERMERKQQEMLHLFQSVSNDRGSVEEFLREGEQLVARIVDPQTNDPLVSRRLVHTLKGACHLFQITSLAELCHGVENRMAEEGAGLDAGDRRAIAQAWLEVAQHARDLMGDRQHLAEVPVADLDRLRTLIGAGAPYHQLARLLETWKLEPLERRLERLGKQAQQLAARLGKTLEVTVDAGGVRVEPGHYDPFLASLVHVVRNAVDHGIEAPDRRLALGKPRAGQLRLVSRIEGDRLVIAISDDGGGIDWTKLAKRAQAADLPHGSHSMLVDALFSDGFSTREEITLVSGRGVGLSAVRAAVVALDGTVDVRSNPGQGATFEFGFSAADSSGQAWAA